MKTTTKCTKQPPVTPGFAIKLTDATELSSGMLIVEDEELNYEPIGCVISINEAKELAASDIRRRMRLLGDEKYPGICPYEYKVWAMGVDGMAVAGAFLADSV